MITGCASGARPGALASAGGSAQVPSGDWDLAWIDQLAGASDRAVFDWPAAGDPSDPIVLEIAARYLENCAAAYRPGTYQARVVLNARTRGVPVALNDDAWQRYALGAEYEVKDPGTGAPAERNPFWRRAAAVPAAAATPPLPTLEELVRGGAILLVCDFALGHLAARLAAKAGQSADVVHRELRRAFVPGAFAVPSGIFGLARAQNAGCAYVRM